MTLPGDWYPSGLAPTADLKDLVTRTGARFAVRRLDAGSAAQVAVSLRDRARALRRLPLERIIKTLDRVHTRLAEDPRELSRLASEATGYAEKAVSKVLSNGFESARSEALRGWLSASCIAPGWLDSAWGSSNTLAFGPGLTLLFCSGNVPGAALPSVLQALLLKSPMLVKTSSDDPGFMPAYAALLAAEDPEVAQALVVTHWPGGASDAEDVFLKEAEAVIAYGSDDTISRVKARTSPHARFIGYGHRLSITVLADLHRDDVPGLAELLAQDVVLLDQQGCLSPHAIYVETARGEVTVEELAAAVAQELTRVGSAMPLHSLDPVEASAIHQYRAGAEMRAMDGGRIWVSPRGTDWTVSIEPGLEWVACPLNRTVIFREIPDASQLPELLEPLASRLISCGIWADPPRKWDLMASLAELGVTRFALPGAAQLPYDPSCHDGINALAALARFVHNG